MEARKKYYKLIGVSLALIIAGAAAFIFLKNEIIKGVDEIIQKDLSIKQRSKAIDVLAVLQNDSEKAKQYLPKIDQMLITKDQVLEFRRDMVDIGRANGLAVSIQFLKENREGDLTIIPFSAVINGSAANIGNVENFLKNVEGGKYFVKISALDVNQSGTTIGATMSGSVAAF